ncbi:hypothetical protein FOXYSP1_14506 [Fusarium oxysporum f. sp. phaseoli]
MKTEIIVAIVSLVVSLPPTLYALHTWCRRRSQSPCKPYHEMYPSRRHSELLCSVSERGITLALRIEDVLPIAQRETMFGASDPGTTLSC